MWFNYVLSRRYHDVIDSRPWFNGMVVAFLYTKGIQLTTAHSGGRCSDLTRRKCNIFGATTFIPRESILASLVLVNSGYLFCNWHPLNTNYYGTTFGGMPGSFNSSQINACVVGIGVLGPRFIVSSEGLGLHKMLPPREFEPSTSRMLGKHCTPRPRLPPWYQNVA